MDVDEKAGLFEGYDLKLNSYDLGVDIELADAIERLRFEYPQARVLVLRSAKPRVFCAGANIRMLGGASHAHKVNFCKFTNETRNGIEDLSEHSGLKSICAINGTAAGGGYELALATDYIMLVDDGSAAVSLPELPLLAVLPGTGGLTRVSDKRKVRRDLADVFCTTEEGVQGKRAVEWRLVDAVVPGSKFEETVAARAKEFAAQSPRTAQGPGIKLTPLKRTFVADGIEYDTRRGRIRARRAHRHHHVARPDDAAARVGRRHGGARRRVLAAQARARARRRDPAYPPQRARYRRDRVQVRRRSGAGARLRRIPRRQQGSLAGARDPAFVEARAQARRPHLALAGDADRAGLVLCRHARRTAVRQRPLLHADRTARRRQRRRRRPWRSRDANFGAYPMSNGLTRLAMPLPRRRRKAWKPRRPRAARCSTPKRRKQLGLVTFALDDIDWDDEVRVFLEERASFSPDGLTGLEANLRFAGPETMESKIFARLTAWQNWIFQRPNAIGEEGALKRYGTGQKPVFDTKRV